MTDRSEDDGTPAPPARSNPEGVRILGAEEAQAALEGGQVARRRGDDEPRYGDVPQRPEQPSRPTVRFPLGEAEAGHDQPPSGVEAVVAPSAGEPSGPVKLPHWTEPPTGDVLQILPEAEPVDLTGEEDAEGWASLTGEAPRFRSSAADWSGADFQPDESLKDEATSVGALAAPPPDLDDDAAFEAEVQARRRRGGRRISATAGTGSATAATGSATAGPGPATGAAAGAAAATGAASGAAEPSAPVVPGAPGPAPEAAGAAAGAAGASRMTRVRKRPGLETEGAATPGPAPAPAPATPGVRIATGLVIAAVVLLCLLLGPRSATVLVMAIVGVGIAELYTAFQQQGYHPATLVGTVGAVGLVLAAYNYGESAFLLVTALVVVFSMLWYLLEVVRARPVVNLGLTLLPYAYVGFLGGFGGLLLHARPSNSGVGLLLGLAVCAVGHDVFGYVIGSQFGRKRITPKVSPNKTLEGLIGGMTASVILGVFFVAVLQVSPWDHSSHGKFFVGLALGLTVAVMAPLGDLCESLLKRDLGLKDLGSILPGHGGILDRFDAVLFCLPAVYYLATWLKIG